MGAGLLYAAIIVGWAAYLIPHALRRYDQASRSRSIDRFSSAMRVLGRKSSPAADVVATVKSSGASAQPATETSPAASTAATTATTASRRAHRAAARAAAKRRRRVLAVLLLSTLTTAAVAVPAYIPWWSVAIPGALSLLFLYACTRQVRAESDAYWQLAEQAEEPRRPTARPTARPAARVESAYGTVVGSASGQAQRDAAAGEVSPDDEPTVVIEQEDLAQIAVAVETSDGGVLWDPVPVTLPTYVSKPRARRTIRTIDLGQPGTWTSGNTEEATAIAEQAAEAEAADAAEAQAEEPRRAVGS